MKKVTTFFSLMTLSLFASMTLSAQANIDPNAPFLKDKNIPKFTLNLTTGKSFSNTQIPKTKYTCIIIFSPDCSHCQDEATELTKNADKFKSVFFIWNSYKEMADKLNEPMSNIKVKLLRAKKLLAEIIEKSSKN